MTEQTPEPAQPREFTTDDGSTYVGVPADEFEDFSNVDHTTVADTTETSA